MNKQKLKEMFFFTRNGKSTIIVGALIIFEIVLYKLSYPLILKDIVDNAIPKENMSKIIILSFILIAIVLLYSIFNNYTERKRKECYYDNNTEIKNKIFKDIQYLDVGKLDKIQTGSLFHLLSSRYLGGITTFCLELYRGYCCKAS